MTASLWFIGGMIVLIALFPRLLRGGRHDNGAGGSGGPGGWDHDNGCDGDGGGD